VTLSASTRGHIEPEQRIGESVVAFSLPGHYDAVVKFANNLKLSKRLSDIPIVVSSAKSVNAKAKSSLLATHLSIATHF
jgi:hypothetical protein